MKWSKGRRAGRVQVRPRPLYGSSGRPRWPRPLKQKPRRSFERRGRELVLEREIGGAELIHLGFLHRALRIQHKRAVALDVKGSVFGGDFGLRLIFEFERHSA